MKRIIALIGKAGSGKDTILHTILEKYPNRFNEIISCTTRPPRESEQDGVNYHFLTASQFIEKVNNRDMLEATEFNGWYYGTMKSSLSEDKINIGVFNPDGIYLLMENEDIDLEVYYLEVKDNIRLIRQLNRENNPDIKEIFRRYEADEHNFSNACLYGINYIKLLNNNLNDLDLIVKYIAEERQHDI